MSRLEFAPGRGIRRLLEFGLAILVGAVVGAVVIYTRRLGSTWQWLFLAAMVIAPFFLVVRPWEKIVLAFIAISLPLNLDFSLIISPYSATAENYAQGHRLLVALTELRVSLLTLALALGYFLWLSRATSAARKPLHFFSMIGMPAFGFFFFSVLSLYQSSDDGLTIFRLLQLLELFLLYLFFVNHVRTASTLRFFIAVLMVSMLAENSLMLVQWLTGLTFQFAGIEATLIEDPRRVAGTLGNPNVAGAITAATLAISCAMIWVFEKQWQKIFAALVFAVGCIALIGTASRTSWISFIVAMVAFIGVALWHRWIRREMLMVPVGLALAVIIVFFPEINSRFTLDDRGSAESRTAMAKLAWNVINAHPLWGVGANNYALVARDYYTADVGNLGYVINSAVHNTFLLTWAETGMIGLAFYLALLGMPLIALWRSIRSNDRTQSMLALGLACALLAMSVQMLGENFIPRPMPNLLWMLGSLAASLQHLAPATVPATTTVPHRHPLAETTV